MTKSGSFEKHSSWVSGADGSGFSLANLCYGVARDGDRCFIVVAIGAWGLDLDGCAGAGLLDQIEIERTVWQRDCLNEFLGLDRAKHRALRKRIRSLLSDISQKQHAEPHLSSIETLTMLCPIKPGDFVDFYSSFHHADRAMKAGGLAEGPYENWFSMPVGYHSRTGSVSGSGIRIRRPRGQVRKKTGAVLMPTRALDFEMEIGFVVCGKTEMGESLSAEDFPEHIFGLVLLNDWSARDLQAWESRPLGPFLSKSFATQLGSWVIPLEALECARRPTPSQFSALDYLRYDAFWGYDIHLEVAIQTADMRKRGLSPTIVGHANFKNMHWSGAQQLCHTTANGAPIQPGDLFGSGTVSGENLENAGCLLERTNSGRDPVTLSSGEIRSWLEDGDHVVLSGYAPGPNGEHISFGKLWGEVVNE